MKVVSDEYLAGIFDGEGFFLIRAATPKNKKMGQRPLRLQAVVSVTITEEYICKMFEKRFGGYTVLHGRPKSEKHNPYYCWNLTGPKIIEFCDVLIPILTIKKSRAKLLRKFQILKSSVGNQPISDKNYNKSIKLYEAFRTLNKRGIKA